jgi:hypothetical protein
MADRPPSLPAPSPFLRHLLGNLRISFFVVVVGAGLVLAYALLSHSEVDWTLPIFIAVGMALSSLLNAAYDARREKTEP